MSKKSGGLIFIRLVAVILLLAALRHNPYGYYIILRWVVCSIFAYCAVEAYKMKDEPWIWVFGVNAAVYNPIIPLHLGRTVWSVVNIVSAVLIIVSLFTLKQKGKGNE